MTEICWVLMFLFAFSMGVFVGLAWSWQKSAEAWHATNELSKTIVLLTSQNAYLLSQLRPNDGEEWKQGGGYHN